MSEEMRALLTGYADGELGEEDRVRVEAALAADPALRAELEETRRLREMMRGLGADAKTEAELSAFWGSVYNRMERHVAWLLLLSGFLCLAGSATVLLFTSPRTPWAVKAGAATAGLGALLLLWSVWRERWRVLRHDRYHREVHR